jgi:hypothetical protein
MSILNKALAYAQVLSLLAVGCLALSLTGVHGQKDMGWITVTFGQRAASFDQCGTYRVLQTALTERPR